MDELKRKRKELLLQSERMTGGGEHEWLWNSRCGMMGFSQVMRRRLTRGDRRAATATLCSGVISPWKRQRQQGAQRNLAAAVISELFVAMDLHLKILFALLFLYRLLPANSSHHTIAQRVHLTVLNSTPEKSSRTEKLQWKISERQNHAVGAAGAS